MNPLTYLPGEPWPWAQSIVVTILVCMYVYHGAPWSGLVGFLLWRQSRVYTVYELG